MTMTCEYTRISLLFHILWKINTFTFEHICTFFPNVFSFNFSLHYCLVACIILYTNGQNYYPFFSQCKVTRNIITWAHCMFSADQVAQLSSVPDYFQYPKLRLSDDCPHCCKSGGTRGIPTLTVFRPADFKSAMASKLHHGAEI